MKGRIDLGKFIKQVKAELISARDDGADPFYSLDSVELEVAFCLDVTGKSKAKLVVIDLEGETKAAQTHKVTLKLTPLPISKDESKGGGGGGGMNKFAEQVCYAPVDPEQLP